MSGLGAALGPFDQLAPEAHTFETAPAPEFPFVMISLPARWALVMPCGCVDGLLTGSARHATVEAAWATFTPNKRSRDAEARKGWTVRPATATEIEWTATPCADEGKHP